jgi:toxin FitB
MIVLDTNVISEAMAPRPSDAVARWLRFAPRDELYTTAVTEAEMRYGAARMSLYKKGRELEDLIERIFSVRFAGRILPFDSAAAKEFPAILIAMQRERRSHAIPDAQIAAIARTHSASVATRNLSDFEKSGVPLIDPWTA